jgi:hypothetical protein
MALVRRASVMGPSGVYVGHAAVSPAVPTQPGPPGAPQPAAAPPVPVAGPGDTAAAAAVPSKPASPFFILLSFAFVALGTVVAWTLWKSGYAGDPFKIGNQTSAYAGATVFAAAVERFLEPFAQLVPGGRKAKAEYEHLVAALANKNPAVTLDSIAQAKAKMDHSTANRSVVLWGLATAVGTVVAALGGFYLLHMIAADSWNADNIPLWVDALVTGLVVGTGTKPLHDLISKLQNQRTGTGKE